MLEKTFTSVVELSRLLKDRQISAVELAEFYLRRIEEHKTLNAYLDVRPEATRLKRIAALQAARLVPSRAFPWRTRTFL